MSRPLFAFASTRRRMHQGPLGSHVDGFAALMTNRGFPRSSLRGDLVMIAHLSRWLERRDLEARALQDATIAQFVRHRKRRYRMSHGDAPALRRFLNYLREINVAAQPAPREVASLHSLHRDFLRYLDQEKALAASTIHGYGQCIHEFLSAHGNAKKLDHGELHARDVTRFILSRVPNLGPGSVHRLTGALRAFFRFLQLQGKLDRDLSPAVPPVPRWRLASLPTALTADQVKTLLKSCDRTTAKGRRNYAILLLMAQLGLRSGEVARLSLEDVDWHAGEITIHGKGNRANRLPLPQEIGQALVAYLRHDRPRCDSRRIFVRVRAPHTGMLRGAVSTQVRAALVRVGLHTPRRGSHLLRHTAATQLLRRGASLFEIGQILNHRHPDTTAIYAKVDIDQLRLAAQPWPGGIR